MAALREGLVADLHTLAKDLEATAPGPIVVLRCVTGHPVYLVASERIAAEDAMYNWTNTNLAVLEVGRPISDVTKIKCVALLYALEAHGLRLPLAANLRTPHAEAIETCALIRGYDRFVQDRHLTQFLPVFPRPVEHLLLALAASSPSLTLPTGHRLAALMLEANLFPPQRVEFGRILRDRFPGLEEATSVIRATEPTNAANEMMRWIGVSLPNYIWGRDRGASAKKPRVHVLEAVTDAVISTTRRNRKDFSLEHEHLLLYMNTQWKRPYVGIDHDRTIPPVAIVLDTHIRSCKREGVDEFELHARIASLHEAGTKLLSQKGGLSISFHEKRRDGNNG